MDDDREFDHERLWYDDPDGDDHDDDDVEDEDEFLGFLAGDFAADTDFLFDLLGF